MNLRLGLLIGSLVLIILPSAPAGAQTPEPAARKAAAIADYLRSCAPQISAHGSNNISGFHPYFRGPTEVEVRNKLQTVTRNNVSGTTFGALERCGAEVGLRHLINGVPGYDHGVARPAPTARPNIAAKPAPPRPVPAAKLPPARPAKMAAWSTKAMSSAEGADRLLHTGPQFAAERADALASCSAATQQFASLYPGWTAARANLYFENAALDDERMTMDAAAIRRLVTNVEAHIATGRKDPVATAFPAMRCLYQRRLAQLEGSPLAPGAVAGTLTPLSIGGQAPPWKQQGKDARIIASNGKSAMDCVKLVEISKADSRLSGSGGRVLINNCPGPVEIGWCYTPGDCDTETGSSWTVAAGRSWPVSAEKPIRWAACHGANTTAFVKFSHGLRYYCSAPAAKPRR